MAATKTLPKEQIEETPARGEMVARSDFPFSLSRMRDEFDQLFERMARQFPTLASIAGPRWHWAVELADEEEALVVRAEAPGFEPGDFDLRVDDNRLMLRASKLVESKDSKGKVRERRKQECYEAITLPVGIDKDQVRATYRNGLLTVTLPKTVESIGRKIPVKPE